VAAAEPPTDDRARRASDQSAPPAERPAPADSATPPPDATTPLPDGASATSAADGPSVVAVPGQDAAADGVPAEAWLVEHAVPGRVRRAPRLGAFVTAGVLGGLVLGTVLSLLAIPHSGLSPEQGGGVLPALGGYNGVTLLTAVALAGVGALVGAGLGLRADRRSRR
jgi:hypothetical protein